MAAFVILAAALIGLRLSGRGLATLTLLAGAYLVFFGLWASAMTTLASVVICVIAALVLGLAMGIWAYRSVRAEMWLRAIMNVMQTVPIFSYLLPTLLLFGYGPSAALFATVVYALPPMVHATVLVDGFVAATWTIEDGTIEVHPLEPLPDVDEVLAEGARLAAFLDLDADRVGTGTRRG